ncbi:MAG: hypothetical protein K0S34_1257 [Bacillales bacterium]|jgi:FkbM family methyltransferase|nr:hypothetical protein [Bacillales bacterium]
MNFYDINEYFSEDYRIFNNEEIDLLSNSERVIIWGAGENGKQIASYLKDMGIKIDCFVDKQIKRVGTFINNIKINDINYINTLNSKNVSVIVGSSAYENEILSELNKLKFNGKIFTSNVCSEEIFESTKKDLKLNFDKYNWLYNILEDTLSKNTLINLLKYRVSLNKSYLKEIYDGIQYFSKDFYNRRIDYFVDGGSFDGDSIRDFIKYENKQYKKIYAIETDNENIELLNNFIIKEQLNNIDIFEVALWNENKELFFDNVGPAAGKVSEVGKSIVNGVRLDDILFDKPIDLIKMDIEGAELNALEGAEKIIQQKSPMLAICVYHKVEDLYTIPHYINKINNKYKFYLRHHSRGNGETVLYAVL